jgi:hypothetical protein
MTVGVTGVMGRGMTPQLHFDGEPGVAAGGAGYGKPVFGSDTHRDDEPGVSQLVQFGSTSVCEPCGAWQRKPVTTIVEMMFPFTLDEVSPQLSGEASNSL